MFNKTFLKLLVIKNLNLNLLTKLQQYLGKYFNLSCLYIGHANRKWSHKVIICYEIKFPVMVQETPTKTVPVASVRATLGWYSL